MNAILQQLRNLGPVRLAIIGGVAVVLIGFFIFVMSRLSGPEMAVLYTDLNMQDASKVTQRLDQLNVPYQLRGDGTQILVATDQVSKARLTLAGEGLPNGGSLGYEVFDKSQGLATSSFVQNINQLRAMEGELERTLTGIDGVKTSRVHLVLPQRELFTRERQAPSASVMLRMNGPQRLERPQIKAIQHLIASSVPGLKPDRISIIDERGTLLAAGVGDGQNAEAAMQSAEEMRISYENRVARAVEALLERSLGFGRVRAEAIAEVDYTRTTQNEEIYNPDQQVVRSTQNVNDSSEQNESDGNPSVTIANNLPQGAAQNANGTSSSSKSARTEETINYEISRTVRNQVREPGGVKLQSVAVMLDNKRAIDGSGQPAFEDDGRPKYIALSTQEINDFRSIVMAATKLDGDNVVVKNMPFLNLEDDNQKKRFFNMFERDELVKLAEIIVLGAVGVLVLLLVVRPLLTRLFEAVPQQAATAGAGAALLGPGGIPQLTGPSMGRDLSMAPAVEVADSIEEMIDLNRIEGRVKASSLRKIGEIVEKHPEDVVAIIRNWLYQET